jgi:hypothetical protein
MANIIAVAGTFLCLIPLPTEEEAPFMSPPYLAPQQIYPYIMGYFDLRQKVHYQQLKNNSGCLSTGLPP